MGVTLEVTTAEEHEISVLNRGSSQLATALRQGARWLSSAELPEDDVVAFGMLDRAVTGTATLREGATVMFCVALRRMKERWECGNIPLTVGGKYEHSFYKYIEETIGYVRSTVDNYIDIAEVWLGPELPKGLPATVELYDAKGNLTGDVVDVDPFELSITRLFHTKANVRDGSLAANPLALGMLFNPKVGYRTVKTVLSATDSTIIQDENGDYLIIFVEGSQLYARAAGDEEPIVFGEIYWDVLDESDTALRAMRHLANSSGLTGWVD